MVVECFSYGLLAKDSQEREEGIIKMFLVGENLHLSDDTHRIRRFFIVISTMT